MTECIFKEVIKLGPLETLLIGATKTLVIRSPTILFIVLISKGWKKEKEKVVKVIRCTKTYRKERKNKMENGIKI
jgi:hypothetical protein